MAARLQELRWLRAGPLSVALDGVDLRYVRLGEVEVVRRIYVAVRDRNWNTIPGVASDLEVDEHDDSFEARFSVRHESHDIAFSWNGSISGTPDGRISFSMDGHGERDLQYNRIGFCVLHPFRECAGRPYRGRTPGGPVSGELPDLVGPQVFRDGVYVPLFPSASQLEIDVADGPTAVFEFEGDLFEMEDQRNWTDASFKTYCTPLGLGIPHGLTAGQELSQRVSVQVSGSAAASGEAREPALEVGGPTGRTVPPIGLALSAEDPTAVELEQLRALVPAHLRVELHAADAGWPSKLGRASGVARAIGAALEVALFTRESDDLEALGEALRAADVVRVLVAPEGAQTTTPEETTPASLVERVRDGLALGDVPIAGGTDMYFCELNRTRPDVAAMDGVFWSQNAQVHAFDDISVLETTEAQGEQVRAAEAFAGGKPLFVGPVTLKRRYNVNATEAEEDDDPPDPRQTAQLGAAWMAASAKHLTEQGAAAVTYFETTGPRGVTAGGEAFPLHRVLGEVSSLCGGAVLACDATRPLEVVGLAVRRGDGTTLLAANLTPEARTVAVGGLRETSSLDLGPYEVVRIHESQGGDA